MLPGQISTIVDKLERHRVAQERIAQRVHEVAHRGNGKEVCAYCLEAADIVLDAMAEGAYSNEKPVKFVEGYQC